MARVVGDEPVEEPPGRLAVVVEAQRLLGGEPERVRRVGVPGEDARELEELPPRLGAPVLAERAPGDAEPGVGRLRVVGELDEQAAEGRRGGGVVARVVVRLAGEQERGGAHLRGHARREHGRQVARGLGELAHLEVGAGQAHGGDPADAALAGPGEVVLRAGLVAVALEPPRFAQEQQHVGARRGRQRRAEQLLGERARLRRLARVHERAHQAHAQRRDQRRAAALEPLGQGLGAVHVGREQGQREAGLGPVLLGLDGRGRRRRRRRQVRAERGRALRRVAGREAPPPEADEAGVEQRVRPALDELRQRGGRALGLAHAPARVAEPERDVARERGRRARRHQRLPGRQRVLVPAERVLREPEPVARPGLDGRRHRRRQQRRERVARARGVAQAERRPAARVPAPDDPVAAPAGGLHHLAEEPVGLLGPAQALERLGVPVARLGEQLALLAAAHRLVEGLGGVVPLAPGEVGAAALERLRRDAEPRADARERSGRGEERGRPDGRRRGDGRRRDRRQRGGRGRQRGLGHGDGRLLDGRLGERHEPGDIGRRRLERRHRRRCGGRAAQDEQRDRPGASARASHSAFP